MASFQENAHMLLPIYKKLHARYPDVPFDGLVGIMANENASLNTRASRFEAAVYKSAALVKQGGFSKAFPGFNTGALKQYIDTCSTTPTTIQNPPGDKAQYMKGLVVLCSSWGLGQLMGYHYVDKWGFSEDQIPTLATETQLECMMRFYQLGLKYAKTYEDLLRWWNTGSIHGETYNDRYVHNGVSAAEAYEKAFPHWRELLDSLAPASPPIDSLNARITQYCHIIDAAQAIIEKSRLEIQAAQAAIQKLLG